MIRRELRATLRLKTGDRIEREIPGAEWQGGIIRWPFHATIHVEGKDRFFLSERMVGGRVRYVESGGEEKSRSAGQQVSQSESENES